MLNEKQTIGGYPKVGTIVKMDLNKLSQLRPGQKITFIPCSRKQALNEWLGWERFFAH
jgi:allophanate hydrolase subunit 2